MKTSKLVIGIISIVLSLVILFQSCAANVGSALGNGKDTDHPASIIIHFLPDLSRPGIFMCVSPQKNSQGFLPWLFSLFPLHV